MTERLEAGSGKHGYENPAFWEFLLNRDMLKPSWRRAKDSEDIQNLIGRKKIEDEWRDLEKSKWSPLVTNKTKQILLESKSDAQSKSQGSGHCLRNTKHVAGIHR